MIRSLTTTLLLAICCFCGREVQAQTGTLVSGGEMNGAGGSVSFSIGQIDYDYISNGSYKISQGLQQPFEIQVISGIEDKTVSLSMTVYPNPVSDYLNLRIEGERFQGLNYSLYNMEGQILSSASIAAAETTVQVSQYAIGTYFLSVTDKKGTVKTFKVIKTN